MIKPAVFAAAFLAAVACTAHAEVDREALYKHIRKSFNVPLAMQMELGELKPSPVAGFDQGTLTLRSGGREGTKPLLITKDGRFYYLSEVHSLEPSKFQGLASTPDASDAPSLNVTNDLKHFFFGKPTDLSIDPDAANLAKIKPEGAPSLGPANAPVLIVEYSDLQCPYCSKAHQEIEANLVKTYGKKVRWIFKHYPLTNIHPWAFDAAAASLCAYKAKPEAFWKFTAAIFEKQRETTPANLRERMLASAKAAGVAGAKFEACFDGKGGKAAVEADVAEANALGVNSTPTIFVNGRKVEGFDTFDSLKAVIDEKLAEKGLK